VSRRPIPTSKLIPVGAACGMIAAAALLEVPDIILIPMAVITVVWIAVMFVVHYATDRKQGDA